MSIDEKDISFKSVEETEKLIISVQPVSKEIGFEELLAYLNKLYDQACDSTEYQEIISRYETEIHKHEKKVKELEIENERLEKNMRAMENDYKALIEIMERARKMVVLKEEEFAQKVKFQMDKNGNLEKLDR